MTKFQPSHCPCTASQSRLSACTYAKLAVSRPNLLHEIPLAPKATIFSSWPRLSFVQDSWGASFDDYKRPSRAIFKGWAILWFEACHFGVKKGEKKKTQKKAKQVREKGAGFFCFFIWAPKGALSGWFFLVQLWGEWPLWTKGKNKKEGRQKGLRFVFKVAWSGAHCLSMFLFCFGFLWITLYVILLSSFCNLFYNHVLVISWIKCCLIHEHSIFFHPSSMFYSKPIHAYTWTFRDAYE